MTSTSARSKRDLIERNAQCWLTQVLVFDIKRDAEQADVARLKLRQEIRRDHIPARATQEETERQIEVQVDQTIGVEA